MSDGVPFPEDLPEEAAFWRAAGSIAASLSRAQFLALAATSHPVTAALHRARPGFFLVDRLETDPIDSFSGFVVFRMRLTYSVTLTRSYERTWTWTAALGPAGFARITGNPPGVAALFTHGRPSLSESDASPLATLFDQALDGTAGVGDLGVRSDFEGMLEERARNWDSYMRPFEFHPSDRASEQLLRSVAGPSLTVTSGQAILTFTRATLASEDAPSAQSLELRRHRIVIDTTSYALIASFESLGVVSGTTELRRLGGRPFLLEGRMIRAPATERDDWSGT